MSSTPRIYLDNAATSWPKPEAVYNAIDHYQRNIGAAAGRGAYCQAQQAQQVVNETRSACARLLGVENPRQIVFTSSGTTALNLAIHGILRPGDHVVSTVCEHNSVLRCLHQHEVENGVHVTYVPCDPRGFVDPAEIKANLQPHTRLVAITHASNVTGAIQPIQEISQLTHRTEAFLLVDAAQTVGCHPIDVEKLDIDLLACGGHKGRLGPLGTGLLSIRAGLEKQLNPLIHGGTGTDSHTASQPDQLPEKYEAGNLNIPALAGLGAALQTLEQQSVADIKRHQQSLTQQLLHGLSTLPGVAIYGPTDHEHRVAVVSFDVEGYEPQEFAAALDASCGIQCRAGLHCAPKMHTALKTHLRGGLVRMSPGWATTAIEIENTLEAIADLASQSVP